MSTDELQIQAFERVLRTKLEPELARVDALVRTARRDSDAWHALELELQLIAAHPNNVLRIDVGSAVYVPVVASNDQVLLDVGLGWLVQFESAQDALPTVVRLAQQADE